LSLGQYFLKGVTRKSHLDGTSWTGILTGISNKCNYDARLRERAW